MGIILFLCGIWYGKSLQKTNIILDELLKNPIYPTNSTQEIEPANTSVYKKVHSEACNISFVVPEVLVRGEVATDSGHLVFSDDDTFVEFDCSNKAQESFVNELSSDSFVKKQSTLMNEEITYYVSNNNERLIFLFNGDSPLFFSLSPEVFSLLKESLYIDSQK